MIRELCFNLYTRTRININLLINTHMKSLLKNLGLILMIIGAAILVGVFFTGSAAINDNGVLGGSAALIVIGLIVYIVLNKRIVD